MRISGWSSDVGSSDLRVVEMENKHGIGAGGREQSLPLIQCCQAKGRKVRKEMPYRMRIERGNDSGAAFRPRPLYRAPGHCLVSEMKPIEIAKPDNGATQMRRYCRAAVKPIQDRKSTRLNSSHSCATRIPAS